MIVGDRGYGKVPHASKAEKRKQRGKISCRGAQECRRQLCPQSDAPRRELRLEQSVTVDL
jgi:hypothetical protein